MAAVIVVGSSWAFSVIKRSRREARRLADLRRNWGQCVHRERDYDFYRSTLNLWPGSPEQVDEQTWTDLNLDLVFALIDRTLTSPGEIELYRILRSPETSLAPLQERDDFIDVFQANANVRENISVELSRLGRTRFANGIVALLWEEHPPFDWRVPLYSLIAFLVTLSCCATVGLAIWGVPWLTFGVMSIGPLFLLNLVIHYRTRRHLAERILSLRYLSRMVVTSRRIAALDLPGLEPIAKALARQAHATAGIPRGTSLLLPEHSGAVELVEMVQEYLSILFLIEVRAYYRTLRHIQNHRDDVRGLLESLGMLDALQSVASFRGGLSAYAKPEFDSANRRLRVEDIRHPLITNPVPNSISLVDTGCLITGANMSGKSTFLRTLGVVSILAQTLFTCPATRYRASFFRTLSALATRDDLVRGKSYYLAEAERLLEMIRSSGSVVCNLYLVDEILRGTNTAERLAASEEILAFLSATNCLVVVATHDLELVDRLAQCYDSYHFDATIDQAGMHADHRLISGPTCTRNAIDLLELLQYPATIVANARRRSEAEIQRQSKGGRVE